MSQFDDDDDDLDFDSDAGINQIRKQLRAANKRLKEQDQELSTLRSERRTVSLKDAIESRNLNPKIAGIIPADVEDVNAWLDEYGDIFGAAPASTDPGEQEHPAAPEGAETFSEVAGSGVVPSGDYASLMAQLQSASSKDDLDQIVYGRKL